MLLTTVVFPIKVPKILIFSALLPSPFFPYFAQKYGKIWYTFLKKKRGKKAWIYKENWNSCEDD